MSKKLFYVIPLGEEKDDRFIMAEDDFNYWEVAYERMTDIEFKDADGNITEEMFGCEWKDGFSLEDFEEWKNEYTEINYDGTWKDINNVNVDDIGIKSNNWVSCSDPDYCFYQIESLEQYERRN
ncbi:hypothetical protein JW813_07550 [Clostridium botulinum]|uniref:hypothetical protein n=1 Tax=Clostridium botulinum TaxID=1491 RepID=UPI00224824A6|nr:hypothetical protein [Clostridium botulinum]UZP04854.1 hypothetical protein JW813_07550 [Clostridium botulinum]UZP08265.1 hypothetical protein JYA71_07820 [Clostridium botulinum]UZP11593.1 hypothetical protein JYA74_07545 [Clostridium botulinum]